MVHRHNCYMNDPDSPARAITFKALKCPKCGDWRFKEEEGTSIMPWVTAAVTHGMKQLKVVPQNDCNCGNI